MAAKLKKRLFKIENKLLKLETLELNDVICSICQSILIEPVTLPCFHDFCQHCFHGSIENNALCCPLCRLRIGSWLRNAKKKKNLVNVQLWNYIKNKFSKEIDKKNKGEDVDLPSETPLPRLSAPGEIRSEYEAELKRLRAERLRLEQKQLKETELLIKKLHKEEEEARTKYLENLKHDELLAQELQEEKVNNSTIVNTEVSKRKKSRPRLKPTTIDSYLSKTSCQATLVKESQLLSDDNSSTDASIPIVSSNKLNNRVSPEMVPNYSKFLKNFMDKKLKTGPNIWNKENGEKVKEKIEEQQINDKNVDSNDEKLLIKTKNGFQSLLVSLPLPQTGILHHKTNIPDNRNVETGSVDSMCQELCYFKPIEGTTPTSFSSNKCVPLRVPGKRVDKQKIIPPNEVHPSRDQYVESLCQLRNISLAQKLPSAFVIALSILTTKTENSKKYNARQRVKKSLPCRVPALNFKHASNRNKKNEIIDGINKLNTETSLRRTRSMGSISKNENEITPKKKIKGRKFYSDRKPHLRSDSKKMHVKLDSCSPTSLTETVNNNKVNLAVKNLSSPLESCDVKIILREQLRIEKIIEQEKNDLELARKMDAEWNGRRQLRRAPAKRRVPAATLRPAKKLKV